MLKKAFYYIMHWEAWHWFAKYIVIGPAWLLYCLKARTLWFYTSSNPPLTFGGFVGDEKKEAYDLLPPGTCPKSIFLNPGTAIDDILNRMETCNLTFPVAVKPASGLMGFMFRKIESIHELRQYNEFMPVKYILQELVTYPMEVSVFYYRFPNHTKGTITGFVSKEPMEVIGDGKKTLWELMLCYPRVQFRLDEMKIKHAAHLDHVLHPGEKYCLSHALNLSRGGMLVNIEHKKDIQLHELFDHFSHYAGGLYYGRYDIRCRTVEELKKGLHFKVLEFNGSGGEPHHVYGNGNTFVKACRILLQHWSILYKISEYNHSHGVLRWQHRKGWQFFKKALQHILLLKKLDHSFSLNDNRDEISIPIFKQHNQLVTHSNIDL